MAGSGAVRLTNFSHTSLIIYGVLVCLSTLCLSVAAQELGALSDACNEASDAQISGTTLLQTAIWHASTDERVHVSFAGVALAKVNVTSATASNATAHYKAPTVQSRAASMLLEVLQQVSSQDSGSVLWIVMLVVLLIVVVISVAFMQGFGSDRGGEKPPQSVRFAGPENAYGQSQSTALKVPPTSGARPSELLGAGPPPLCASLILSKTEARFLVPLEGLVHSRGDLVNLDIRGTSGSKLMHATMEAGPNGQLVLALFLVGCEHDPRAIIQAATPTVLEIYGRGKRFYGTIELLTLNNSVVKYEGVPVMTVDRADSHALSLTASSMGQVLACGSTPPPIGSSKGGSDSDSWGLKVKPGADAILIMSCMLAMMLLQPRMTGRPTVGAPRTSIRSEMSGTSLVPRAMPIEGQGFK